jgi:hypothetical protein
LRAGTPAHLLAESYGRFFWFDDSPEAVERVTVGVRKLGQAQVGVCRFLHDDPAAQEVSWPVIPQEVRQMTWKDGAGQGSGPDPQLLFTFPEPRRVYAIRLKCCLNYGNTAPTPVAFHVSWRPSRSSPAVPGEPSARLELDTGPAEKKVTILVNDTIDQFCIHPDNKPCVFRLSEIVLVTPGTETRFAAGHAAGSK